MEHFFRLEYNEKNGNFHFDNYTHNAFSKGYVTIHPYFPDYLCSHFFIYVLRKYPVVNLSNNNRDILEKPTNIIIYQLFEEFIKTLKITYPKIH